MAKRWPPSKNIKWGFMDRSSCHSGRDGVKARWWRYPRDGLSAFYEPACFSLNIFQIWTSLSQYKTSVIFFVITIHSIQILKHFYQRKDTLCFLVRRWWKNFLTCKFASYFIIKNIRSGISFFFKISSHIWNALIIINIK